MKAMKNKKNKKNKSQKAQQSFTERIAKAAGGVKERAKSMTSEEQAKQTQESEQPENQQPEQEACEVDIKALQEELEKAKAQSDEYLDLAQRKQAEFANYRRRTEGIRAEAYDDGRDAIAQLLPVVDNLERALAAAGEEENALKSGVEMVLRQTRDALTKMGVEEIDPQGQPFDAELMNAVMQGSADEGDPGTVCMVLQKGYKLGERVIRHAMVKVVAG